MDPRDSRPSDEFRLEVDTLVTCLADCQGGKCTTEGLDGRYRMLDCKWCNGLGVMTPTQARAYRDRSAR